MPLLEVQHLDAFYGDFQALFDISFELFEREIVAIIGANGAGKSTFLKSLIGHGTDLRGRIQFDGCDIVGKRTEAISRLGITMAPEGRRLFPSLTVEENLLIGCSAHRSGRWTLGDIYSLFPVLKELRRLPATSISGGQQQMAAIGRALLTNPRVLLCDEISLGLAPKVVNDVYQILPAIRGSGVAVLLVEQDITRARNAADRIYCFLEGRVSLMGKARDFSINTISRAYFGT